MERKDQYQRFLRHSYHLFINSMLDTEKSLSIVVLKRFLITKHRIHEEMITVHKRLLFLVFP